MPRIANSDVVVPAALSSAQRRDLIDSLYAVHRQIFDGVDRDGFAHYVVESTADHAWILRHRDDTGAVVGYVAVQIFDRTFDGAPASVFRTAAGNLRDFRGANTSPAFALRTVLRHLAERPTRRAFYVDSLVHPSSYSLIARHCPRLWPRPDEPTPPPMLELMDAMATEFGLPRVHPDNPLVRHDGWRTIETETERAYWLSCDKPAARFFIEANPGFPDGHSLIVAAPLNVQTMVDIAREIGTRRVRTPVESAMAVAQRSALGRPVLRATVARKLRAAPLFAGAAEATIRELADRSEVFAIPGGRPVLQRGDASQEVYLLARGAVYVLDEDEHVVDELGTGSLFGEIAMLAGERRSASIRTATRSLLVRIPREVLLPLMDRDPGLGDGVWDRYAERRFDDLARAHPEYRDLPRAGRLAHVRGGERRRLGAGETLRLGAGESAFIFRGAAELQDAGVATVTRGTTLIRGGQDVRIRGHEDVRLVLLDRKLARAPASVPHRS